MRALMTSLWIAAVLPAFPVVTHADPAPRAADLAVAERFIDAFYSFDATRLEHALAAAPTSMPVIGFYQRWALGGNYRIVDRRPCESVDASGEIGCAITVKDDLMGALGIAFEVTDTFHLRVADGVIRSVSTSSNDLEVFRRAEKWVWREREALVREPCTGYFDGGPTPELCVRAMVEGFAAFRKTAEFREQAAAEAVHGIDVAELTVESAGEGLRNRRYTARQLAEAFLVRIAIYNPGYNAIITPNPEALREAAEIDRRRAAGEPMGALAGIPVVVKDTIDIAGLPTTAGWARLSARAGGIDLVPVRDAPVVERLRGAGAVILGKTNVPVLSLSADNANDSWAGPTFNAAAPRRAPGGSSAGTATAVAASFAILGLAEETGGSIQNPAAFQSLVGIKPTFALVPNSGVVPIGGSTRDVVGPIARTVRDAAIALDVLAGYTAEDPKTAAAIARVPAGGYAATLAAATLRGKRLGTYGTGWRDMPLQEETRGLYERTLGELRRHGAQLIEDPFAGSGFAAIARLSGDWQYDSRGEESVVFDMQRYLARAGGALGIRTVEDLIARTGQDPFADAGPFGYIREQPAFLVSRADPAAVPDLGNFARTRARYLSTFSEVMDRERLDAIVLPQAIAEAPLLYSGEFSNSTTVSEINIGGFPAITVPAGYYASGTPFATIFVGRPWDERRLIELAHAFEQQSPARRRPELVLSPSELVARAP